ncbi:MAG: threonine ammonia-lyase [Peptostreptococcaceae bacterium]|nr:threonine ammonia-lyase [Peptostreptococcaceae bacterium]
MQELTLQHIKDAKENIKGVAKRTQLLECSGLSEISKNRVFLKLENLQKTGSFKIRGAYNKICHLTEEEKKCGVIASSAGNHAQGVALGAKAQGIDATIVMPANAPLAKVKATKSYGANVVLHGNVYDDAYAKAVEIQKETGATFLHPFDDVYVAAGQGTIGLEILEDLEEVDVVLVPIGGGGIISGIACALKELKPSVKVIGVEAASAPSMKRAVENKGSLLIDSKPTIADGIGVRKVGDFTYKCVEKYVDEIVTVEEEEIAQAILFLIEKDKVIAEGAGAVCVAALLNNKIKEEGKNVVSVVSGGNIDVNLMDRIIDKALMKEGRRFYLNTIIPDKSGELVKLIDVISKLKANIFSINQTNLRAEVHLGYQSVELVLESFGQDHMDEIVQELKTHGYEVSIG